MHREIDEIEALLLKWAEFMRRPDPIADWYPEVAAGGFIESWIKDSEELSDAADLRELEKIGASISSLSKPHYIIIHKVHGIGYKVWRFPDEAALYLAAKTAFSAKYHGMHQTMRE